jgi:DNA-binding LytR/AlgR family response regulator
MAMSSETLAPEKRAEAVTPAGDPKQSLAPVTAPPAELPPLLRRLKPENRGLIRHIAVEDHYTFVKTSRGSELILLRFSDALAEIGGSHGLQVHRSHWVADDFVCELKRVEGRLMLKLADGTEVPVSRTYIAEVRARFE